LLILDGGPCDVGIESTIIDCTRGVPVLLRPGAISREQVQAACGLQVLLKDELIKQGSIAPRASGTLESHYAPKAKVRLMDAPTMQSALDRLAASVGADDFHQRPAVAIYSRTRMATPPEQVVAEQMPPDAASTAHQLFAVLRALDAQGVNEIWIETPSDAPEWDGVRDRLQRAAAS
jgi:L-threonylcarbamoyladenylate synthase